MKTKMLLFYSAVILMVGVYSSCSKNEECVNEISLAAELKFIPLADRINERIECVNRENVIIISWEEWGRKKKDCKGWGLCNGKWFPERSQTIQIPNPTNGGASILEYDALMNKYYFDILLADYPPATILLSTLTLMVDEDIVLDLAPEIGNDLFIKQGGYDFDRSLSDFGGYRIYLEENSL